MSRMAREPIRRKTPDDLLREVQAEEGAAKTGHLKIFLGYASGVGKSFRMLDEARRRRERGQDVVVGAIQPKVPPDVEALLPKLEVVPLKTNAAGECHRCRDPDSGGARPYAVIDGLAYDNPPGSRNPTRWQDVQELLGAGIKVIASINIQYIAELREQVEVITGKRVSQTVPVAFIESADEIEIVDAPPEEPPEHSPENQVDAVEREQRLSRLRELALVLAADVVDQQLRSTWSATASGSIPARTSGSWSASRRAPTPAKCSAPPGRSPIAFTANLIAAYVNQPEHLGADQAALDEKLALARAAGARRRGPRTVKTRSDTILGFARAQRHHAALHRPQPALRNLGAPARQPGR